MIKLFEVSLAQNGWIVTTPAEDENHIDRSYIYLDNNKEIEEMLYHFIEGLAIDTNQYSVTIKVKKVK